MTFPPDLSQELIAKAKALHMDPRHIEEHHIRGSGHGGQKINKTSSCVQLVYHTLGMEVRCQDHREQSKNRLSAWQRLIDKVEEWRKDVEHALAEREYHMGH